VLNQLFNLPGQLSTSQDIYYFLEKNHVFCAPP